MTQIYKIGTATVANGSVTVEGSDTGWATALVTGGLFSKGGLSVPIESVTDDDTLVLAEPWPGPSGTGIYTILRDSSAAASIVNLNDRAAQILIHRFIAGLIPAGAWSSAKVYVTGEYVQHGGRTFASLVEDNEDNEPPSADADDANWMWLPVVNGADGADGVQSSDSSVDDIIALTQAEYDLLDPPDASTFYIITPEPEE